MSHDQEQEEPNKPETQEHQTQQDRQRYEGSKNPGGMDTDLKATNINRDIVNDQGQDKQKYFED